MARRWLRTEMPLHITSEEKALEALQATHAKIRDISGDELTNRYFKLVEAFIDKYSLRYDLRRPLTLHPTLPGIFARMVKNLKIASQGDEHLASAFHEFEDALRDLTVEQTPARIKTCIHKQVNLLEGLAQRCTDVNAGSLGEMCNERGSWPHATVKEAMKKLYGFSSNYPGIRHAGNPASALREIEMRDLVSLSVALFGFAPYLTDQLNSEDIYRIGEAL